MPRMGHPKHGYHICGLHEVKDMEAKGWKISTDEEWRKMMAAKNGQEIEADPGARRPGRPPKAK